MMAELTSIHSRLPVRLPVSTTGWHGKLGPSVRYADTLIMV